MNSTERGYKNMAFLNVLNKYNLFTKGPLPQD